MSTALIFATERPLAFELIAKAKELGFSPHVAAIGDHVASPEEFNHRGADAVHVVESPALAHYPTDATAWTLAELAKASGAAALFVAGTRRGKEIAPYAAEKLGAGMITFAQKAHAEGGKIHFERLFLGGKTVATEVAESPVVVATFATRLFEPLAANAGAKANVQKHALAVPASRVKVLATKKREDKGVNIEEAPVVVGAGRGFKTKDDLKLAWDVAQAVGGQVGCTRPLATDLGWLTDEYWIGLSGKEVKPKLYVAAGISGQIQHTTGIRNAKVIVAINTNKDAPIFKTADYGIVGDLYKVLPALEAAFRKEVGKSPGKTPPPWTK